MKHFGLFLNATEAQEYIGKMPLDDLHCKIVKRPGFTRSVYYRPDLDEAAENYIKKYRESVDFMPSHLESTYENKDGFNATALLDK